MKKSWSKACVVLCGLVLLFGCSTTAQPHLEEDISLEISGSVSQTLTSADFNKMDWTEVDIPRTSKDTEFVVKAKGILLSEVLDYVQVDTVSGLALTAQDGYSQAYDQQMLEEQQNILVFFDDGELLDEDSGPIWLIAPNLPNNMSIKQLIKIELVP